MANDKSPLSGIFTPNLTLVDEKGQVLEEELRRYTDWLIDKGVHGLYPNGSTGEFTRFRPEERRRIATIIAEQTAGRVPILAGAAEENLQETLKTCEFYAELGVRAVAVVSPFYYKLSPDAVYAYFAEIGKNSPIDVTLYNIPMFASPIDVPTVQRLSEEYPRIIGIKDSSGDLPHMMRMIQAVRPNRPDFTFMTGWDAALLPMLLMGCNGGTNATSGIAPEWTKQLFEDATSGNFEAAKAMQYRILQLFDRAIGTGDFPDGFRVALQLRGFKTGWGRQPQTAAQKQQLEELRGILAPLLDETAISEALHS
ncbi:Dihydrodipicolinate synthetase [Planctomycetales bacterium 10988]|nr:Dihydrodipicolinate synthetase [Planctomycetales bacterium 10988]